MINNKITIIDNSIKIIKIISIKEGYFYKIVIKDTVLSIQLFIYYFDCLIILAYYIDLILKLNWSQK